MAKSKPAEVRTQAVRDAFQSVLRDTRAVVEEQGLESPVDIEVTFRSLKVTEKGVWVFSKNKEEQLEIRLATRVMPPSE